MSPAEKLLAIEEIKILKARYFRFVDGRDWDNFRTLFADDAVFAPPTPPPGESGQNVLGGRGDLHGADAFVAYAKRATSGSTSVHKGFMPEIEIVSPDEATGIWGMEDIIRSPTRVTNGHGYYREEYVRRDGVWRIRKLALFYKSLEIREVGSAASRVF